MLGVLEGVELSTKRVGVGLGLLDDGLDLFLTGGPMVKSQTDISGAG